MTASEGFAVAERGALEAALAAAGVGTWRWTMATGVVRWDSTLESLCGIEPGGFASTFDAWLETLDPSERDEVIATVEDALARGSSYRLEHRTIWPDGTIRWLECRGEVVTDLEGDAIGTVGCAVDITDRKLMEIEQAAGLEEARGSADRLGRLQNLSRALSGALSADDVTSAVLDGLANPSGATTRALWLVDAETGDLVLVAQRGMKPTVADMFERIDRNADLPGAVAIRERRTVLSPSRADSIERFPELHDTPRSAQGFIAVPLVAEGAVGGVLAFGYEGPLEDDEVSFLEAAAGHIAQTLKRVRLAEALKRRAQHVMFLADIARAGVSASDHRDLMRRIAATAVPLLGDSCSIHFVPESGAPAEAVVTGPVLRGVERGSDTARAQLVDEAGVAHVLKTGRAHHGPLRSPQEIETSEVADDDVTEVDASAPGRVQAGTAITVPIRFEHETVGALQIRTVAGRTPPLATDVEMTQAAADLIGEALQNRWMTDQHKWISTSLQRALLPPTVPTIPGVEIATVYWPAGAASYVGGDFYDVFAIGDQEWAVLIGDACGTGPDAAATAAIARHTARAAARHGLDHGEVLAWVNQAVKQSDRGLFCTASYATLRVDPTDHSTSLAVAMAGHPLPILVRGGAAASVGTYGTLLGVYDDPRFTVEHAVLGPGDAVVFYTDGLTDLPPPHERTTEDLQQLLGAQDFASAGEIVDHLERDLEDRLAIHRRADDTAILVIRNRGLSG